MSISLTNEVHLMWIGAVLMVVCFLVHLLVVNTNTGRNISERALIGILQFIRNAPKVNILLVLYFALFGFLFFFDFSEDKPVNINCEKASKADNKRNIVELNVSRSFIEGERNKVQTHKERTKAHSCCVAKYSVNYSNSSLPIFRAFHRKTEREYIPSGTNNTSHFNKFKHVKSFQNIPYKAVQLIDSGLNLITLNGIVKLTEERNTA